MEVPAEIIRLEKELEEVKQKKQEAVFAQNFELAASYRDKQAEIENEINNINSQLKDNEDSERPQITEDDIADTVS